MQLLIVLFLNATYLTRYFCFMIKVYCEKDKRKFTQKKLAKPSVYIIQNKNTVRSDRHMFIYKIRRNKRVG